MLRAGCGAARGGGCLRGCAGFGRAGSCAASRGAGRLCPPPPGPHCHPVTYPLLSMQHPVPWGSPTGVVGRRAGAGAWGVGAGWCMGRAGVSVLCQSPSVIKGLVEGTAAAVPSGVPPHASAIAASCCRALMPWVPASHWAPAAPCPPSPPVPEGWPPAAPCHPPQPSGQGHGCSRSQCLFLYKHLHSVSPGHHQWVPAPTGLGSGRGLQPGLPPHCVRLG